MFNSNDQDNDTRLTKAFWKAIDDSPFMMLGLEGVEDDQTRPMTAQVDVPEGGDDDGFASLSEVGQRATAVSSFAVRNYGFSRLSDLIKAVPNFEVKTGTDGRLAIKRLR